MTNKYYHTTIALAGVIQSSVLVPQLANTGVCSSTLYEQTIHSLFITSPQTTEEVYGGIQNIKTGLQTLVFLFSSGQKEQLDVVRYLLRTLSITSRLIKNNDALNNIDQRLTRISGLYPIMNEETISSHVDDLSYSLAGIYSDIISPLTTKIKVMGKIEYLQNSLVQAKVRTSLLGCIRSAILWYQVGGSRLQLFFQRKRLIKTAQALLQEIEKANSL